MTEGDEESRVVSLHPAVAPLHGALPPPQQGLRVVPLVAFHRTELGEILRVYGRMVASGEWRDYAIDHGRDEAAFSVFRRMGETPMYRITKTPKLARKQGAYAVVSAHGLILKRGHELSTVLRVFERKRHFSIVSG